MRLEFRPVIFHNLGHFLHILKLCNLAELKYSAIRMMPALILLSSEHGVFSY